MSDVTAYITRESVKAFEPGATDCASTADRWVTGVRGFSPLARYGRHHRNNTEMSEWLSEPGGIAVAVNRVMRHSGFKKTKCPSAGDVGLILHKGKVCVAIHTGAFWFSRDESGLIGESLVCRVLKAWKI